MKSDVSPTYVPATAEYVLAVFRDQHRQDCSIEYDAEPQLELTFETTIGEWRFWCDLLDWRRLGRALDTGWKLGLPDSAWRAVLEPARCRTLRDLCSFIAQTAFMPSIEPVNILNSKCVNAGAFLAIRSTLEESGVNVDSVAPSTPLEPYARRHLEVFLGPIARLAPNSLPDVKVSRPLYELCFWGLIFGLLVAIAGSLISPIVPAGGLCVAAALVDWGLDQYSLYTSVPGHDRRRTNVWGAGAAGCGGGAAVAFRVRAILTRWPTLTGMGTGRPRGAVCGSSVSLDLQSGFAGPEVDHFFVEQPTTDDLQLPEPWQGL